MRKFTYLILLLFAGSMLQAQTPVVTEVWNHSIYGTADWSMGFPEGGSAPSWMGAQTERGMAFYDGKLYIVSRKVTPNEILVLDAATGDSLSAIAVDMEIADVGTFAVNDIAITPSGKILVANLATNTHNQPFRVYVFTPDGEGGYAMSQLLSWNTVAEIDGVEQPFLRIGDGFAYYGDVSEEGDGYIIVGDANGAAVKPLVYRWNVEAGVANPEPVIIELKDVYPAATGTNVPKLGPSPRIQPLSNDLFLADGHSTYPALYNMQGELLSSFTGPVKPLTTGISGVNLFKFKDVDYIFAPTTNHAPAAGYPPAAFQLFRIPEAGAEAADSIAVFPEKGLGKATNSSYVGATAVDVQADHVMLYMMSPLNGIAAYKLTVEEAVPESQEWNMSDDAFNDLGSMVTTRVVNGLTIYAAEGKNVDVDANNKELEEWVFTHRIKFGGTGSFDEAGLPLSRVLGFNVPGKSKITIVLQSSSGSADRKLNVAVDTKDNVIAEVDALGASISKSVVEYEGGPARILLYSPSSGVNIYLIKVEALTSEVPVVDKIREEIKVYPNPTRDRVFVSVERPTEVGVYTLSGSLIKLKMVESEQDYIDLNDVTPGVYIIKSTRTNDFSQKLIKM